MPLVQGGPPEWIWERTPDTIRWELVASNAPDRETRFELRVQCGLDHALPVFHSGRDRRSARRFGRLFGGSTPVFLGEKAMRRVLHYPVQGASPW
jgi:hypothetical protein